MAGLKVAFAISVAAMGVSIFVALFNTGSG